MTYEATELSQAGGSPVECYEFETGGEIWRWVSGDAEVILNGVVFAPYAISRSPDEQTVEAIGKNTTITVPRDNPVAALFRSYVPAAVVSLVIYRVHQVDGVYGVVWSGRVRSVVWSDSTAQIICDHYASMLKRQGLRYKYQVLCNHMLYGPSCHVQSENYRTSVVVTAISGNVLSVSDGNAAGYYVAGEAVLGGTDRRMIVAHPAVGQIEISMAFEHLSTGATMDLYAGCNRQFATCRDKFANNINFGGFPFIPTKNPFTGEFM